MTPIFRVTVALLAVTSVCSTVWAQDDAGLRAAGRAFEEAQRAQLEGDFPRAAQLFEVAHRAAPAAAALRSAIRNHRAAGAIARAATLSLEAITGYASDAATRNLAQEVLSESESQLARVRVRCASLCGVLVDGGLASLHSTSELELFVDPGTHTISATFDEGGQAQAEVELRAGESQQVNLQAPAPEVVEPEVVEPEVVEPEVVEPEHVPGEFRRGAVHLDRESSRGWSPLGTWVGIGVTAGLGAMLVWSILDLFDTNDSYEANPSQELYDSGQDKIRRTWLLGMATSAAAIGTVLIAVLATDWTTDDDDDQAWTPQLSVDSHSLTLGVMGQFGGVN